MRLARYGPPGAEKPAVVDDEGNLRDLSQEIEDLRGDALASAALARLARLDKQSLPLVDGGARLGPCVAGVGKLLGQHDGGIAGTAAGDQGAKGLVEVQRAAKQIVVYLQQLRGRADQEALCLFGRVARRIGIGLVLGLDGVGHGLGYSAIAATDK